MGDQIFPAVVGNSKKGAKQMAAEVAVKILSGESVPRVLPDQVQRASLEEPSGLGRVPPSFISSSPGFLPAQGHVLAVAEVCCCSWPMVVPAAQYLTAFS